MSTKLEPQTHVNNNTTVQYNPDTVKKGTSAGNPILRPDLSPLTLSVSGTLADYIGGPDKVKALLVRYVQQNAAAASREALDKDTNSIDLEDWNKLISGVSIAGETLDELRDRLDELKTQGLELSDEYMKDETTPERQVEIKKEMQSLREERASIEKSIADKEEIGRKRVAARKANEEAKKASSPDAETVNA